MTERKRIVSIGFYGIVEWADLVDNDVYGIMKFVGVSRFCSLYTSINYRDPQEKDGGCEEESSIAGKIDHGEKLFRVGLCER